MELLSVENLVFFVPLAFALLFVLLMAVGIPMGDHDVHADVAHAGHGDLHGAAGGHAGVVGAALSFMGVGKAPFAVLIVSGCLTWGIVGLGLNQLLDFKSLVTPMILAAGAAVLGTRWVAQLVGHVLPSVESYFVPANDLVSERAEVIHEISKEGGLVRLTDRLGTLRDLACRLREGQDAIPRGTRVVLTHYHETEGVFNADVDK